MKKVTLYLVFILLLAYLPACSTSKVLSMSGTIESTQIDINAEVNGKIIEVLKDEGSVVKKDDIIAIIDPSAAQIQVKNAEASLKSAQAKLDELKVGTRVEQIQQAEANAKTAKAKLDELKSGSREEQIRQAEASLKSAKARLDEVKEGSRSEQIAQTEAVYQQAENAVITAQNNYDYRLNNLNRITEMQKIGGVSKQQLDDAQNAFDLASRQLINSKEQLNASSAQLDLVKNGSTAEVIAAAEGNYEQAEAQYELVKNGATVQAIKAAEGNYEQTVAQVKMLKNGATLQTINSAEANVEQLQAVLDSAKLQLEKCTIKSPIDGIVLTKAIDIGQVVSIGTNIMSIQQNRDYWIKVYLPQEHITKVNLNQKVKIKTSALPNKMIDGTVIYKSPKAEFTPKNIQTTEAKERDTVIAVKVKVDNNIENISAGMIATVLILQ